MQCINLGRNFHSWIEQARDLGCTRIIRITCICLCVAGMCIPILAPSPRASKLCQTLEGWHPKENASSNTTAHRGGRSQPAKGSVRLRILQSPRPLKAPCCNLSSNFRKLSLALSLAQTPRTSSTPRPWQAQPTTAQLPPDLLRNDLEEDVFHFGLGRTGVNAGIFISRNSFSAQDKDSHSAEVPVPPAPLFRLFPPALLLHSCQHARQGRRQRFNPSEYHHTSERLSQSLLSSFSAATYLAVQVFPFVQKLPSPAGSESHASRAKRGEPGD